MERMEFRSEMTRFLRLAQYLVTLKILRSRRARRTDRPNWPASGLGGSGGGVDLEYILFNLVRKAVRKKNLFLFGHCPIQMI